ncbi:DUF6531 domain-containing protein [Nonomuraea sp. NPDC059007]|uniref:DUF6531 domain-containing protein n=1 Tax=Nonomuraea sp. NPDC059007 TaxID=3346692 RepID=UPI003699965A
MPLEKRADPGQLNTPPPAADKLPPGAARAEAADARAAVMSMTLVDVYPQSGMLVDSLRPALRAWAQGASALSYQFELCAVETMSGATCTNPGYLAGNKNAWTVPAGKLVWGKQYWWRVTVRDTAMVTATSPTLTFTTGVRQPTVTSGLATQGPGGREFDPRTGNYTTTVTDVSVPTAGLPLEVQRTYNSMDPRMSGMFGAGWSTSWDMKILAEERGGRASAVFTAADGRQARFADFGGTGTFQPPPGMQASLVRVPALCYAPPGVSCPAGGAATWWHLMDKTATKYIFDDLGRLRRLIDSRGRQQDLSYGPDGLLAKVTATGGRSLTFTWSGGRVAEVATDPVDGAPLKWTYTYEAGRLTRVCTPAAAPNCAEYTYGSGSQYRSRVLDADPFAYWRLGEATGTVAADQTHAEREATYQSVTLGEPGALAATPDTAAKFTIGSVVKLPGNIVPHLGDQVSVELWFKTAGSGVLAAAGTQETNGAAHGPMLYVGTDGKLRGALGTVSNPITSAAPVNDNAWHHAVLTVSGVDQALYLDGQRVGTTTGTVTAWRQFASIGNGVVDPAVSPAGPATKQAFPLQGAIDEVALYGQPLTEAEIADHFAARVGGAHQLTGVKLPSGRTWAANTYDPVTDRLATHTDSNGGTWKVGPLVVEVQSGESTVTVTDPATETLKFYYDAWRGYRPVGEVDQLGHTTWYNYDQAGYLQTTTDRNNIDTRRYHDARGNVIARWYCRTSTECAVEHWSYYLNASDPFDPRNDRMLAHRDGRSASETDNTFATTRTYNTYGEQTRQTTPATADFPNGRSATIAYTDGTEAAIGGGTTPPGLIASQTDARNSTWIYRYTKDGDLAEQTSPLGMVTKLGNDSLGRLSSKTEVSQAHPDGVTNTFTYDRLGRPLTQTESGVKNEITGVTHTKRTTLVYDADGNKLSDTIADLTGGDSARETVYSYNAHGKTETITGPEGGIVRQTWNALGQPATVTDARGTVSVNGYSKRAELISRTLQDWTGSPVNPKPAQNVVLETLSYDPGGRLAARVDAMNRKTTYTYWDDNRPSQSIADAAKLNGSTTPRDVVLEAREYDPVGSLIKQVTGGGITTAVFDYDAASRLTTQVVDPAALERVTAFTYDANGNTLKTTRTAAGTARIESTERAYNKLNQPTRETVENGTQDLISTIAYDDRGLATAVTDPRGNVPGATAADFTTTMRYDALGRLADAVGPQVAVEKAGISTSAKPTTRIGYDTYGTQTHTTDPEGRTTSSVFDKAGRLISQIASSYTPPGGAAVTPTTTRAYDVAGQLIKTTDPRGNVRSIDYDQLGREVRITDPAPAGQPAGQSVIEYDLAGEKLATVDPTGARTEATYDDLGRTITTTQVERKPTVAAYTTKLEYNDAGVLTKQIAPGNRTTGFLVNAAGEVTTQTDPALNKTLLTYDLAGRMVKTTDGEGNATVAEYDLAGRQIGVKDLNGTGAVVRSASIAFDAAGNPTSATSPEGYVTKQTYDALSRVTSLIEPVSTTESITTSFGYDASGARTRLTDGRGNATWTSYNSLGLAESVTEPSTAAHPNLAHRTWTSSYDQAGNPTASLLPGGVRIDRTFDHLNRLTAETGAGGGAATAERTFSYDLTGRATAIGDLSVDYNDRGLPLSVKKGTVQQTSYTYNELGNPSQRVDSAGAATFTWDNVGRLATAVDPATGRTLTYGYDKASRLKTLTGKTSTGAAADSQTFTYDAVDRLETQTLKNGAGTQLAKISYGWDKDDNLTTKTTAGTAGAGTNTYTYDHAGRLTSWTAPSGAKTDYGWDASGNRTKAGTKTFTYDERNRLTTGDGTAYSYTARGTLATETKNGTTTQLTYDAFDRLIADGDSLYSYDALNRVSSRIRGTAKQTFAYSGLGNDLAAIADTSGGIQAKYGRDAFGDLLGLQEGASPAAGAFTDLHRDVVATFTSAALATSTAYDPFGTVTAQTGTKANLGYQSEYTDPDTGKSNMHARWYQPGTGTFTSRDTATLNPNPSVQANRYTYANASPLTGIDPTGHATESTGLEYGGGGFTGDPCSIPSPIQRCGDYDGTGIILGRGGLGDGGPIACTGPAMNTCGSFELRGITVMTQAQMKQLGHLPNGAAVPKGFWKAPKKIRGAFIEMAYDGVEDFVMKDLWDRYTKEEKARSRSGGGTAGRGAATHAKCAKGAKGCSDYQYFTYYKDLLQHYKAIKHAADEHGIDLNALIAVLIYENDSAEPKSGPGAWAYFYAEGWDASLGITQLEVYKARALLELYYPDVYKREYKDANKKKEAKKIANLLINKPWMAIHLAAANLRYVKTKYSVKDPRTGQSRSLTDWEATLAYCGCTGNPERFRRWHDSGYNPIHLSNAKNRESAMKRLRFMQGWGWQAAEEYWEWVNRNAR